MGKDPGNVKRGVGEVSARRQEQGDVSGDSGKRKQHIENGFLEDDKGNYMKQKLLKIGKLVLKIVIGSIISLILLFVLLVALSFCFFSLLDTHIEEKDVRAQIAQEQEELFKYNTIFDYVERYKSKHGVYPDNIDINIKSNTFENYEYHPSADKKTYRVRIYPKNGPIEYYVNNAIRGLKKDERCRIDGFADNEFYYQIGDKWQAVHFQYYTRYRTTKNEENN